MRRLHAHQQQADDHRDIADAVGEEAPALADGRHQNAGDRRAHHSRGVEHGGIQRDGVHEVGPRHHFHDEGLARRDVEGVDRAQQRGEYEDMPDVHAVREGESGEDERQQHGKRLRGDDHAVAAVAVRHDAAERGEKEDGNLAAKADSAQQDHGPGEPVHEPRLGKVLHPGPDERNELAREKQLKITVLQGSQRRGQFWHCFYFKASTGPFGRASEGARDGLPAKAGLSPGWAS